MLSSAASAPLLATLACWDVPVALPRCRLPRADSGSAAGTWRALPRGRQPPAPAFTRCDTPGPVLAVIKHTQSQPPAEVSPALSLVPVFVKPHYWSGGCGLLALFFWHLVTVERPGGGRNCLLQTHSGHFSVCLDNKTSHRHHLVSEI